MYVKQRKLKIHVFDVLSETQIKHSRRKMLKMMLVSILSLSFKTIYTFPKHYDAFFN